MNRGLLFFCLSLISCAFWPSEESYRPYEGPRDIESLKQEILKRYGWQTFLGTGRCRAYDDEQDKTYSFDFEIRIDRNFKAVRLVGTKTLAGSLFDFVSRPGYHLLVDYFQSERTWTQVGPQEPLQAFAQIKLNDLREVLFAAWPPVGSLQIAEDEIIWGPWRFETQSLALKSYQGLLFVWNFKKWRPLNGGLWRAGKWHFQKGNSSADLIFDNETEENFPFEMGDFDLEIENLNPPNEVAD